MLLQKMDQLLYSLNAYLQKFAANLPPLEQVDLNSLPLHLRERYAFYRVSLFGHSWLMAVETAGDPPAAPSVYLRHMKIL